MTSAASARRASPELSSVSEYNTIYFHIADAVMRMGIQQCKEEDVKVKLRRWLQRSQERIQRSACSSENIHLYICTPRASVSDPSLHSLL